MKNYQVLPTYVPYTDRKGRPGEKRAFGVYVNGELVKAYALKKDAQAAVANRRH